MRATAHLSFAVLVGVVLLVHASARGQDSKPAAAKPAAEKTVPIPAGSVPTQSGTTASSAPIIVQPDTGRWSMDSFDTFFSTPQASCPPGTPYCMPMERQKRFAVYGEYLSLQPGDAATTDVAVPINGAIVPPPTPPVPVGATMTLDPDYAGAYRVGLGWFSNHCTEWSLTYTYLSNDPTASASVDPQNNVVLYGLVMHPSTAAADLVYQDATADGQLEMNLLDLEYRRINDECHRRISFIAGVRLGQLTQDFHAQYSNATRVEDVTTDIDFEGVGVRFGMEGEVHSPSCGLMLYGRGIASLLAGQFDSTYTQRDSFDGTVVYSTREDDSIVPILDLELGIGWRSQNDCIRLTAGYLFSGWFGVVSNQRFIESVQDVRRADVMDTLTFDGLTTRVEVRF